MSKNKKAPSKIYFTADTHFGHTNIIRYCGRPFETKEEHDRVLIENWNNKVQPQDVVYHLGDFGFGTPDDLRKIAAKLQGKIHFIRGNHDKPTILDVIGGRFASIKDVSIIYPTYNDKKITIFLSYPVLIRLSKAHSNILITYFKTILLNLKNIHTHQRFHILL